MHTEPNNKDRIVTDEHPGYDARAHWCGEDTRYADGYMGKSPAWWDSALSHTNDESSLSVDYALRSWGRISDAESAPRPNLRRVRAWAEWAGAAWRIVKWLLVFALGVLVGAYADSGVWK